jgi:hypothetical protein
MLNIAQRIGLTAGIMSLIAPAINWRPFRGPTAARIKRYKPTTMRPTGYPGAKLARKASEGMVTRRWPGLAPQMKGPYPFSSKR